MSSSVHIDNENKDTLILGKGPTEGLDGTTLTREAEYSINFSISNKTIFLSLPYIGNNNFLFVNDTNIYQSKGKNPEIKKTSLVFRKYCRRLFSQ